MTRGKADTVCGCYFVLPAKVLLTYLLTYSMEQSPS